MEGRRPGEDPHEDKAETGLMLLQAEECQELLAAMREGRKAWNGFSLRASRRN